MASSEEGTAIRRRSDVVPAYRRLLPSAGEHCVSAVPCPATLPSAGPVTRTSCHPYPLINQRLITWCRRKESNPRPSHYE